MARKLWSILLVVALESACAMRPRTHVFAELPQHLRLGETVTLIDRDGGRTIGLVEGLSPTSNSTWTKQRLQQVLFPEGLKFDGERFGTAVTCLAFKQMAECEGENSSLASPPGFEPGFWP
jgi:hypothetical protein